MNYVLVSDSCVDLPQSLAKELDLIILPLKVYINGNEYKNYLDEREISTEYFYNQLRDHKKTSTSQATPSEFYEILKPIFEEGKDVLYVSFSSALSGTYNSSILAKKMLLDEFPERTMECVDSLCASMGQGLFLYYLAKARLEGKSLQDVKEMAETSKQSLCHLFTVDDLGHLRRGGRLSAGMEIIGTILNVKPLMHVSPEGRLTVYGKARGRIKSLHQLVNRLVDTYDTSKDQMIFISHGDCLEDALFCKELIKNKLSLDDSKFVIHFVGPVIGSHSGVGTIAIFYLGNERSFSK